MNRITYAQPVNHDQRTDVREPWGPPLGRGGLADLTETINDREDVTFRLEPGLLGWAPATHTLFLDDGCVYHVAFAPEESSR